MTGIVPGVLDSPSNRPNFNLPIDPADYRYLGWVCNPTLCGQGSSPPNGVAFLGGIRPTATGTMTKMCVWVNGPPTTPTANQNKIGIYDASGTLLQQIDITTALSGSSSNQILTIPGFSVPIVAGTTYYAALLQNAVSTASFRSTAARTPWHINGVSSTIPCRWMISLASNLTTLPSTFAPMASNLTKIITFLGAIWMGIAV